MILRIQKHVIATIAAVAIAVTGFSAAPARAGDDEAAAAIAALLGLAVIGAVIADKRKDKKERREVSRPRDPRPLPPRVSRKLLPQECLRSFHTDHGKRRIFGQRCLRHNYGFVNSLPRQCHREFYTDRGWRQGYSARCLNRHGYQLARR
ncbi:hypothetical protein [uncultured Tateyamaria sp.]|uniref:hypothetical protein n=1 Tax=Tateyamaria sp. 1078 TaxID=3417464 RepID=UPI00260B4E92|nr:hypothetical protein [uncultured Tateyamaria sp.]